MKGMFHVNEIKRLLRIPLLLPSWPLAYDHFVAVLWSLGTRLPRPCSLRSPAPNRHRMLVGL